VEEEMDHNEKKKEERALWKNRITDLNTSGLTVTQYAKTNDLSVHQIYYWKARLGDRLKILQLQRSKQLVQ